MRNLSLSLVLVGVLAPVVACGGAQTRSEVAHERAGQYTDDRYAEVQLRMQAVEEAERAALAAEQTEALLRNYEPQALQSACDILSATPADPAPVAEADSEVIEISDVDE